MERIRVVGEELDDEQRLGPSVNKRAPPGKRGQSKMPWLVMAATSEPPFN
jgi:hypothetical protein